MYQKDKFVQFAGCMAIFFPWCLLCDISSRMGEGCCFATCCPGALLALRIKLRVQENIQVGSPTLYAKFQYHSRVALRIALLTASTKDDN